VDGEEPDLVPITLKANKECLSSNEVGLQDVKKGKKRETKLDLTNRGKVSGGSVDLTGVGVESGRKWVGKSPKKKRCGSNWTPH